MNENKEITAHPHTAPDALHGILMKVASVVLFTIMALIIKVTATEVPAGEAVFFRSLFGLPPVIVWLIWRGDFPSGIRTSNPIGHFWRGLAGVSAMTLSFSALGLLPYPDVVAIGYAAPVFVTVLAAMFLGERLRVFRMSAVAAGLVGVMIILYPKMSLLNEGGATTLQALGAMMALTGALSAAIAQVFIRQLVKVERSEAIVFWFQVTAATLALVTIPMGWSLPAARTAGLLILAGLLGGVGQVLLTESYRHAEMAVIASFEYVSMILALLAGYFLFGEAPTSAMLGGAALIVAAGLFIVYRERRLGLERGRARKVMTPQG